MLLRNPLPIAPPAVMPAVPASTCLPIRLSSSPISLGSRSFSIVSIGMPWRTHSAVISWIMPCICEYALPAPSMSPVSSSVSKIPLSFDSFSPIAFAAASKLAVKSSTGFDVPAIAAFVFAIIGKNTCIAPPVTLIACARRSSSWAMYFSVSAICLSMAAVFAEMMPDTSTPAGTSTNDSFATLARSACKRASSPRTLSSSGATMDCANSSDDFL